MDFDSRCLKRRRVRMLRLGHIYCHRVWFLLLCFILAGCVSPSLQNQKIMDLPAKERPTDAAAMEPVPMFASKSHGAIDYPPLTMVLMPGDEIEISFLGAPDLGITQAIRRDGKISLRLVGEMMAAGKTPAELRADLIDLYSSQIQFKEVTVKVLTSQPVFVLGAVLRPSGAESSVSSVDMSRPMSVMDAIAAAGGFDETCAEVRSVIIMRKEQGRYRGFTVNCAPLLHGRGGQMFYLQPYDIIYVPRTFIAKADQWVDQHITQLLPTLGVRYNIDQNISISR